MSLLVTDPVCFARDTQGHLTFPLRLVAGLEAVAIGVQSRVKTLVDEWFADPLIGVPYLPGPNVPDRLSILGQKFDGPRAVHGIRKAALTTPGVLDVVSLAASFDGATRAVAVTGQVTTTWGDSVDLNFQVVL